MKRSLTLVPLLLVVLAVSLSGCNPFRRSGTAICKEPEGYSQAVQAKTLTIPAGLESPDTRNALRVPDLNTPEPPARRKTDGCLDEPPNFQLPPKPKEPAD